MRGLKYERVHGGPPLPPVLNHSGGTCMRMDTSRMCQKIFLFTGASIPSESVRVWEEDVRVPRL